MSPLVIQLATVALFSLLVRAVVAKLQFEVRWRVMALGALFYMAQVGARAPLMGLSLAATQRPAVLLAFPMALLSGTFEEGARWLGLVGSGTMRRCRSWGAAVVYGTGFGAAEAIRLTLLGALLSAISPAPGRPGHMLQLMASLAHVPMILFHCGWSTLVMFGVVSRRPRYLILALAGHVAIYSMVFALLAMNHILGAQLAQGAGATVALAVAAYLYTVWPLEERAPERPALAAGAAIVLRNLTYVYPAAGGRPAVRALDGLSLEVESGRLLALLGHNGAGKTTMLRILGGLLRPTAGQASVAGKDVERAPEAVRELVGLQSDEPGLYRHMPVATYLDFFARLYDLPRHQRAARVEHLLTRLGLGEQRDAPAGSLSKGNRQKVALARTLLHQPRVLLLDEPTSGLDPAVSMLVREMIAGLKREGRTIVLATHNLFEAQALADEVAIVHRGRLIRHGQVAALQSNGAKRYTLELAAPRSALGPALARLRQLDSVSDLRLLGDGNDSGGASLGFSTATPEAANPEVLSIVLAMGLKPYALAETRLSLEQVYLDLARELDDDDDDDGSGEREARL